MERRSFLRAAVAGAGSVAFGFSVAGTALAFPARSGPGPYGVLRAPDANGIALPAGFTSRVLARSGRAVAGTGYTWHSAPDGGACFADGPGWIYVSNSEVGGGGGGASALRLDAAGAVTGAYRILSGTTSNCSGGATPWGTWLSCEETTRGYVHETFPRGGAAAVRRAAMGRFKHEAAAASPARRVVYLTEDEPDGCFYRFVPTTWGDLSAGVLEVARVGSGAVGAVTWARVPDPSAASTPTRRQVSGSTRFDGGEGAYHRNGTCFFTTKGDDRVWAYDEDTATLAVAYDDDLTGDPPLTGVDNITGDAFVGDLYVAEDGGDMEVCVITPDDVVAPFLRIRGQSASEICGVAFNPAGDRLYFSSQRGTGISGSSGITYEVTGPFRTTR